MKNKLLPLLGFVIILILTLFLVFLAGTVLAPEGSSTSASAIDAFHTLEPYSLDIIVYGSSHAWKGCDTKVLESKYDYSAYNYGCDWQALDTTILFVQDSFRTQKPKYALIEAYLFDYVLENTNMDGQIYYTKHISNFPGKRAYLSKCFSNNLERYASYYFPIIMFHDNWSILNEDSFKGDTSIDWHKTRGYYPSSEVDSVDAGEIKSPKQKSLPKASIEALDKLIGECNQADVTPIFFTCPWIGGNDKSEVLKEYADSRGIVYVDLFDHLEEMDFSSNSDFRDHGGHLNDSGAEKVATYLGHFIQDKVENNRTN